MQAIVTKYHGPTNSGGSRVSARAQAGRVTVEWDDALSTEENHDRAALALCVKFKWTGVTLFRGGMPNNGGCIYVQAVQWARVVVPSVHGEKGGAQ